MNKKLINLIQTVIKESGLKEHAEILPEHDLRDDLGMSSLELATLTVYIEEEFKVDIFEKMNVRFVKDIEKILNAE